MAKYKMSKLEKEILEAAAKAGEAGFFADLEIVQPLVDEGLLEINPEIKNDAGEVATRIITTKGNEIMSEETVVEVPKYEIEDGSSHTDKKIKDLHEELRHLRKERRLKRKKEPRPSRSVFWPTTARSTPCAATSTGCRPGGST